MRNVYWLILFFQFVGTIALGELNFTVSAGEMEPGPREAGELLQNYDLQFLDAKVHELGGSNQEKVFRPSVTRDYLLHNSEKVLFHLRQNHPDLYEELTQG